MNTRETPDLEDLPAEAFVSCASHFDPSTKASHHNKRASDGVKPSMNILPATEIDHIAEDDLLAKIAERHKIPVLTELWEWNIITGDLIEIRFKTPAWRVFSLTTHAHSIQQISTYHAYISGVVFLREGDEKPSTPSPLWGFPTPVRIKIIKNEIEEKWQRNLSKDLWFLSNEPDLNERDITGITIYRQKNVSTTKEVVTGRVKRTHGEK